MRASPHISLPFSFVLSSSHVSLSLSFAHAHTRTLITHTHRHTRHKHTYSRPLCTCCVVRHLNDAGAPLGVSRRSPPVFCSHPPTGPVSLLLFLSFARSLFLSFFCSLVLFPSCARTHMHSLTHTHARTHRATNSSHGR